MGKGGGAHDSRRNPPVDAMPFVRMAQGWHCEVNGGCVLPSGSAKMADYTPLSVGEWSCTKGDLYVLSTCRDIANYKVYSRNHFPGVVGGPESKGGLNLSGDSKSFFGVIGKFLKILSSTHFPRVNGELGER